MTVPEPTMIVIAPWDPSAVSLIDKAIRASDLGLNPTNDGKVVRVPIPALTEERRKDMVKHLHKVLENHRTAVRNIRRDIKEAIDKLEKDKKISQDEQKRARRSGVTCQRASSARKPEPALGRSFLSLLLSELRRPSAQPRP
jgi:ribosome recycling factor